MSGLDRVVMSAILGAASPTGASDQHEPCERERLRVMNPRTFISKSSCLQLACTLCRALLPNRLNVSGAAQEEDVEKLVLVEQAGLFPAKNLLADVRPKFLEDVIQHSGFHLRSPIPGRLTQAALLRRIISVGQTRFQRIACHFGPVEARASRICLGEECTGDRVARAAEKTSLPHGVIARILVRDCWDNGLGEKNSRYAVRESAPIIASVTNDSVAQLWIGI